MKSLYYLLFLGCFQGFSQTLENYLQLALENNPLLQSESYQVEDAKEAINSAGSLANTRIGIVPFLSPVQTRVGNQSLKISIGQNIPWFGVLKKEKQIQASYLKSQNYRYHLMQQDIIYEVSLKYYGLCYLLERESILKQSQYLLEQIKKIALEKIKTNQYTMVYILKIQVKQKVIENQIEIIKNEIVAEKESFALKLGVQDIPIKISKDDLKILEKNPQQKEDLKSHLKLKIITAQEESLSFLEELEQKKRMPQFYVGIDYTFVDERSQNIAENGRDVIMPMIQLSVPIFSKRHRSKVKQLQWQQKSLQRRSQEWENNLKDAYQKVWKTLENLKNTIATLEDNIKQTQQINSLLLSNYTGGQSYFQELLDNQQWQLDFQLKKSQAEKNYAETMAKIKYLNAE